MVNLQHTSIEWQAKVPGTTLRGTEHSRWLPGDLLGSSMRTSSRPSDARAVGLMTCSAVDASTEYEDMQECAGWIVEPPEPGPCPMKEFLQLSLILVACFVPPLSRMQCFTPPFFLNDAK